jgi:uncharacterized protein (DUF2062 family)
MHWLNKLNPFKRFSPAQRVRQLWHKLIHLQESPQQIAGGFAIGVFTSFLPVLPFDTPIAMGVAWVFRRNAIAAMIATSITIVLVPIIPFIWYAAYHIGKLIVPAKHVIKFSDASLSEVLRMGWDVFTATLIGSMILAAPIGLISYVLIKRVIIRWRQRHKNSEQRDVANGK